MSNETDKTPDSPYKWVDHHWSQKYDPENYPREARELCKLGATMFDLAQFFEVTSMTIARWIAKYPAFCRAVKLGNRGANTRVKHSLYQKAIGYSVESEKIFLHEGKPVRVRTTEHFPPDTTACIFWLKNRDAANWRDVKNIQKTITKARVDSGPELRNKLERALAKRKSTAVQ